MSKFYHHLQVALITSLITLFCIILIKSLGLPELIRDTFFEQEKQIILSESENIEQEDSKIPTQQNYEKYMHKGDLLAQNAFYSLAIEQYKKAVDFKPHKGEPYFQIALIHEKNIDTDKAIDAAYEAYKKEPNEIKYQNLYFKTLIQANKKEDANKLITTLTNTDSETLLYKGIALALNKNYEESEKTFNEALVNIQDENLKKSIQGFIDAYKEFGLTQSGKEEYREALIAQNLIKNEFYEPAIELIYGIIKEEYNYRDAWIMLGYANLRLKNYLDSIEAFQTALDIDPVKSESRYFLGLAYFGVEKYSDAISNIEIAIKNGYEPKSEALQQLAEIAILNEEFDKAADAYEQVLKYEKTNIETYIRPVWLYIEKLDKPDRAITIALNAVEIAPENALSYSLLGWALTAKEDYKNAYKNLQKAIKLDPNLASSYLNLGWLYQKQGDTEKAKENYLQSYELDSNGPVGGLAGERYNEIINPTVQKEPVSDNQNLKTNN